jgi:hypothetical protein
MKYGAINKVYGYETDTKSIPVPTGIRTQASNYSNRLQKTKNKLTKTNIYAVLEIRIRTFLQDPDPEIFHWIRIRIRIPDPTP